MSRSASKQSTKDGEDPTEGLQLTLRGQQLIDEDKDQLYWAVGLGVLATLLVMWAASTPLSCVTPDPEAVSMPSKCDIKGADELELPYFCWNACMGNRQGTLLCLLVVAVALQGVVIILNHSGCAKWMRLTVSFDLQRETDLLEEEMNTVLKDLEGGKDKEGKMMATLKQRMVKLVQWIKTMIVDKIRSASNAHSGKTLIHVRTTSLLSDGCLWFAGCAALNLIGTSFSGYTSFFECGDNHATLESETSTYHMVGLVSAVVLLFSSLALQRKARWTRQITLNTADGSDVHSTLVKAQFNDKFFPRQKKSLAGPFKKLDELSLRYLAFVQQGGNLDTPDQAFRYRTWRVPVTLHFKAMRRIHLPDNKHRLVGLIALFGASLTLFLASKQCWVCVEGVRASKDATFEELSNLLLLLGACGRHQGMGTACFIGSLLLAIAFVVQAVIVYLTDSKYNGGPAMQKALHDVLHQQRDVNNQQQQLWLKLWESAPPVKLAEKYAEAGKECPEVWSYVWVRRQPAQTGKDGEVKDEELIMDCASDENRESWVQSKVPRLVRLHAPPKSKEELVQRMTGLVREDLSPPTRCIRITPDAKEDQDVAQKVQMVPPQFLAGRLHMWLNIGPKEAWEKTSGGLSLLAFCLAMCDILYYLLSPRGQILTTCNDVLNDVCIYFHIHSKFDLEAQHNPIVFRPSTGHFLAIIGGALALIACLCLRVAYKNLEAEGGCCWCCSAYFEALFYSVRMAWTFANFVIGSIFRCIRAIFRRHCCCYRRADEDLFFRDGSTDSLLAPPPSPP